MGSDLARGDDGAWWARLVDDALQRVGRATGFKFVNDGVTTARPFDRGNERARGPVVIGWADPEEFPGLEGPVAGLGGGSTEAGSDGRLYLVTGGIALDTEAFTPTAIATSTQTMEAVVLHELGHVIGLAHVAEPMELMFDSSTGLTDFGPGDLEGLARLGSVPCR